QGRKRRGVRGPGATAAGRDGPLRHRGSPRPHVPASRQAVTTADAAPSLAHLLGRLEVVGRRVAAAVEWRRSADPDPADRFRGLHISPAQVEALLAGAPPPVPPSPEAAALLEQIEAEADAAEADGADLRLRRMARTFDLGELE